MMANKNRTNKTIILPIEQKDYAKCLTDTTFCRMTIDKNIERFPNLFPDNIKGQNYKLNGKTRTSSKMKMQLIKIKVKDENYQIQPSYILPYMRGLTAMAEKALFFTEI